MQSAAAQRDYAADIARSDNPTFQDILAEYQTANERLARVAAPLRLKNAPLCQKTWRDPGFAIHDLEHYPDQAQDFAKTVLHLKTGGIYVQSVRPHSSAEEARIAPGDQILAVNENAIKAKTLMESYNRAVFRNGFESVLSKVKIRTPEGRDYIARIQPETVCDIPVKLVFSENINGHTDGQEVLITSALMRSVPDDTNLALVIAHEMSHVIADHMKEPPPKRSNWKRTVWHSFSWRAQAMILTRPSPIGKAQRTRMTADMSRKAPTPQREQGIKIFKMH